MLDGVTPSMPIFQKQTFSPIIYVTECNTEDEVIELANTSVFSQDVMRALHVTKQVRAGSCQVNGPTVYIEPTLPNGIQMMVARGTARGSLSSAHHPYSTSPGGIMKEGTTVGGKRYSGRSTLPLRARSLM